MGEGKSDDSFELAVVGCGLIGSATARHAILRGARTLLIGPVEPDVSSLHSINVFGAHYDEGRITRKTDPDAVWSTLATRSIDRYNDIATAGGEEFFSEVGHLAVSMAGSEALRSRVENAAALSAAFEEIDAAGLAARFPRLRFPPGCAGVFEPLDSGHISPRGLLRAQVAAAQAGGCVRVDEEALSVEAAAGGGLAIHLSGGTTVHAARVVVAAGAFSNAHRLFPRASAATGDSGGCSDHLQLQIKPLQRQTLHLSLDEADAARLAAMPSLIFKGPRYWSYLLPPIRYPDGSVRVKLGGDVWGADGRPILRELTSALALADWYRSGGDEAWKEEMQHMVRELLPGLEPLCVYSDVCAASMTPTGRPYIGQVPGAVPGVYVATGGNGLAAKSSDEIGRLAAAAALAGDLRAGGHGWGVGEELGAELFTPLVK